MKQTLVRLGVVPRAIAVLLVRLYQWTIRPIIGPRCRYLPHCSDYAIESFQEHGLFSGGWLTTKRLCRCHPWATGGLDPVPAKSFNTQRISSQPSITD
ncbi:membrane protein insertion efficiency factor YidD [beta proteobacterium MWH-UniP1]